MSMMSRIQLNVTAPMLPTLSMCFTGPLGVPTLIRVAPSGGCIGLELDGDEVELDNDEVELAHDEVVLDNDEVELANDEVVLDTDEVALGAPPTGGVTFGRSSLGSGAGLNSPVSVGSSTMASPSWLLAASSRPLHKCA